MPTHNVSDTDGAVQVAQFKIITFLVLMLMSLEVKGKIIIIAWF